MRANIKKLLSALGGLCVILIVVEEFFESRHRRPHPRHWISDMKFATLNGSTRNTVDSYPSLLTNLETDQETGFETDQETAPGISQENNVETEQETGRETYPEMARDIDPESALGLEQETGRETYPEMARDIAPESALGLDQETGTDINQETSLEMDAETSLNIDPETVLDMDPENDLAIEQEIDLDIDQENALETDENTAFERDPDIVLETDLETGLEMDPETDLEIDRETAQETDHQIILRTDKKINSQTNQQTDTRDKDNTLANEALTTTMVQLNKTSTAPAAEFVVTFIHPHDSIDEAQPKNITATINRTITADDMAEEEDERLKKSPYIYKEALERSILLPPPSQTTVKLVSYYLPWDKYRHRGNRFRGCRYNNCRYVNNMSLADAVLFRASAIRDHVIPDFYRPKDQRWVFFTNDPAVKHYRLDRPDVGSKFNWTMTYQLHSDFPILFGLLRKRVPPPRDFESLYDKKDKEAAWFVSHCPTWSRREQYVKRMRGIINVDIFGKCGNMTCGPIHYRRNDTRECLPMLTNNYKFYLAFENSFCKDYVSEKFFKLFNDVDIIPVVRGGFNYKKYLPSGIFVDSSDFKTPEDLARHLLRLGQNKTEYVNMLRKKSEWTAVASTSFQCLVCQALHTSRSTPQFHPNLTTKFNGNPPDCWLPRDLALSQRLYNSPVHTWDTQT